MWACTAGGERLRSVKPVEANDFGFYPFIFDSPPSMGVDQSLLQWFEALRALYQLQRWRCGPRLLTPPAATGKRQVATILAFGDVEDSREACLEGVCHRGQLSF